MKRYALILLCLIGLSLAAEPQINRVYEKKRTTYIDVGFNLKLEVEEASEDQEYVSKCELRYNNSTTYTLYPNRDENVPQRFYLGYDKCHIMFLVTKEDEGLWEVIATIKKKQKVSRKHNATSYNITEKYYSFDVKVKKKYDQLALIPATSAWVYPDQQVSAHFTEHFENFESCKILTPEGQEYDLYDDNSANRSTQGQCGFKIIAKKETVGAWTLIANMKDDTSFYNVFQIHLEDEKKLKLNQTTLFFERGQKGDISAGNEFVQNKVKMCILEDPHGAKLKINSGKCSRSIDPVTEHHEGIWKAYIGVEGIERLIQQTIVVKLYNVAVLNSTISQSSNGDINLLCRVGIRSVEFCSFVRPDGEMFHMTPAIGNSKYSYYGTGSDVTKYDCGLTIHNPEDNDYGSWRCLIRLNANYRSDTLGRILKVTPPTKNVATRTTEAFANDVYVTRDDSIKVKCRTDEVLSYCWLRSPNGTMISIPKNVQGHDRHKRDYERGLELGECVATLPVTNDSDAGVWTCHMGIDGGPEIETKFNVIVQDSYLMASKDMVIFNKNEDTDLIFHTLPNSEKVIRSCRWISPQGYGINIANSGRYMTSSTTTYCKLSIRTINFEQDPGMWSCHAIFGDGQTEGSAKILVTFGSSSVGSVLSAYLTIAIVLKVLFIIGLGCFGFYVYKRRRNARLLDEKLVFEKPPKFP